MNGSPGVTSSSLTLGVPGSSALCSAEKSAEPAERSTSRSSVPKFDWPETGLRSGGASNDSGSLRPSRSSCRVSLLSESAGALVLKPRASWAPRVAVPLRSMPTKPKFAEAWTSVLRVAAPPVWVFSPTLRSSVALLFAASTAVIVYVPAVKPATLLTISFLPTWAAENSKLLDVITLPLASTTPMSSTRAPAETWRPALMTLPRLGFPWMKKRSSSVAPPMVAPTILPSGVSAASSGLASMPMMPSWMLASEPLAMSTMKSPLGVAPAPVSVRVRPVSFSFTGVLGSSAVSDTVTRLDVSVAIRLKTS
jgi:hypothetical protein